MAEGQEREDLEAIAVKLKAKRSSSRSNALLVLLPSAPEASEKPSPLQDMIENGCEFEADFYNFAALDNPRHPR